MRDKKNLIDMLGLVPHPEGGYYKEVYRSEGEFTPLEINQSRNYLTSIFFLLEAGSVSHFHVIKSDELWYYHAGAPCLVHLITPKGEYHQIKLGLHLDHGETPFGVVPAGTIFGSESMGEFSLVSCAVAPGFDFEDFKLFTTAELIARYPAHEKLIRKFTKEKY